MKLKDLQDQFQRAILSGDGTILGALPNGAHEGKEQLLSVYQDGYMLRLVEVVASDHDALQAYLGADAFDDMARAYLTKYPSQSPNARWVADRLPKFLSETEPYASDQVCCDLAKIEHALADAFDSKDAASLGVVDMGAVAPEDWAMLTFAPHPSCRRIDIRSNAFEIWQAVGEEDASDDSSFEENALPKAHKTASPQSLIVWRQAQTSMIRPLNAEESMMWDEAAKGVRFGVLCELLATYDDPDGAAMRAASYLRAWLDSEMLQSPLIFAPSHVVL